MEPHGETGLATDHVDSDVFLVRDLLELPEIEIPDYQRPYKWSVHNVGQLIDDISEFMKYGRYRIGTVILHRDERGTLNIVDGQQRFITFCLIAHCLTELKVPDVPNGGGNHQLPEPGIGISQANVANNYAYIHESLGRREGLREWAEFFWNNCEVVVLTLRNVDEAFQMFDSQNTRGRPLFPTDLLKAFHIREMSSEHAPTELKMAMVELWEKIPPESINELFSDYLFKVKRWANSRSVPTTGFASQHVHLFKGIRESNPDNADNRWSMPYLYAKNYTDDFKQENSTLIRYGALRAVDYPFQIDHPVINGETFFLMVSHYYDLGRRYGLFRDDKPPVEVDPDVADVLAWLEQHRRKSTYRLVNNLFDSLLLYYVDRFGSQDLQRASKLILQYAMTLRAQQYRVTRQMVDNYALGKNTAARNLFQDLREAMSATDFLRQVLPKPERMLYAELDPIFDGTQWERAEAQR